MEINIATYSDGNYMQHVCVMLVSLDAVAKPKNHYNVYLFYSDTNDETISKLQSTVKTFHSNITINYIACNFGIKDKLPVKNKYVNSSIYDKILIYKLLPKFVTKILFIDADYVLLKCPSEIFNINLKDSIVCAVREKLYLRQNPNNDKKEALALENYKQYFNSGFMLINLPLWFSEKISEKALEFAFNSWSKTSLHDQDAINYAIHGRMIPLDARWNPRSLNKIPGYKNIVTNYFLYRKQEAFAIHFSGVHKPWLYLCFHPARMYYKKFLSKTHFRDYQYPDYNFKNIIKKPYLFLKHKHKKTFR